MRTSLVTYCSRDKDPQSGLLPAVDRYRSLRIQSVAEAAASLGFDFHILSGLYGLIKPTREIPDYDHLLTEAQVAGHAGLVAGQLEEFGVARVIFVTRTLEADPGTEPYRETMRQACGGAGVRYETLEVSPADFHGPRLRKLVEDSCF